MAKLNVRYVKCATPGCDNPDYTRYLCRKCYQRAWYRHKQHGEPLPPLETDLERFMRYVDKPDGESGCWIWAGYTSSGGYSRFHSQGKEHQGHRWLYEQIVGEIPSDMEMDHLCRCRPCVNPDHLTVVTTAENLAWGDSVTARNGRKTHCKHGHLLEGDNLYIDTRGHRQCKACRRKRMAEAYAQDPSKFLERNRKNWHTLKARKTSQ